jgi:hypothetical protein
VLAWLLVGFGPVNYDTLFNVVWGGQLADGETPRLRLELAPTPKPLVVAAGVVLAPLGHAVQPIVAIAALLALGALATAAFAVTALAGGRIAGLLAAVIVLTREPVLSFGVRAYLDVAYVALVLAALAVALRDETRPRAVLGLLAVAGLIRPEAWAFSAVYLGFVWTGTRPRGSLVGLTACAPVLWVATDLALTGSPLWSLTGTRDTAEVLGRATGLDDALALAPRRVGEIVREPVLLAALAGAVVCLGSRDRARRALVAALALALATFAALAVAGLPVLGRYLMLVAALTIAMAAVGTVALAQAALRAGASVTVRVSAGLVLVAFVAFVPAQVGRLDRLRATNAAQRAIAADLHVLADEPVLRRCAPVRVPNHRLVPLLADWLDRPPEDIRPGQGSGGVRVLPASRRVARLFVLDPRDPATRVRAAEIAPPGASGRGAWRVAGACSAVP